ncbi:MAG: hypothetical protein ACRC1P_09800 [Cellulosilyticaceae bacterium]
MFVIDEEIKMGYLNKIKNTMMERSYILVRATLKKLDLYEEKAGMSIRQMNEVYVEDMLKSFDSGSSNSLVVMFNIIKNYVFDYVATTKNDCIGFTTLDSMTMDQVAACVSKNKANTKYLTYNEYMDIVNDELLDPQAKVIFVLIWNGIRGKEYADLRNVKESDVDVDNKTIKVNDRVYTFSKKEMEVIEEAIYTYEYTVFDQEGNVSKHNKLEDTAGYLVKRAISKINYGEEPTSETIVKVRIKNLADQLGINTTGLSVEISSRVWHIMEKIGYNFNLICADVLRVGIEIGQPLAAHNINRIWDIFIKKYEAEKEKLNKK